MRLEDWMAEEIAEEEREELLRKLRRERRIEAALMVAHAAASAIALLTIAVLLWMAATAGVRERAAWNEGYYGVDHQTALALAEAGVGKSAADILR